MAVTATQVAHECASLVASPRELPSVAAKLEEWMAAKVAGGHVAEAVYAALRSATGESGYSHVAAVLHRADDALAAIEVAADRTVPNVVGKAFALARAALLGVDLDAGVVTTATGAAGVVLTQSPAAGSVVFPGSSVSLVLGDGRVAVPNIVGGTAAAADAALAAAGLTVGTVTTAAGTLNQVLTQSPAAATVVNAGTSVGYSKGDGS